MINQLIQHRYRLPSDSLPHFIKKKDLGLALSLRQALKNYKQKFHEQIQAQYNAAQVELNSNKSSILMALNTQCEEFNFKQEQLLEEVETVCKTVLTEVLEHFHLSISYKEKLYCSLTQLLSEHRNERSPKLVVQSIQDFKKLDICMPNHWKVSEDPAMNCTCKLVLENSIVECNFDALFNELTQIMKDTSQ